MKIKCTCVDDEKRCAMHGVQTPAYMELKETMREMYRLTSSLDVSCTNSGCPAPYALCEPKKYGECHPCDVMNALNKLMKDSKVFIDLPQTKKRKLTCP